MISLASQFIAFVSKKNEFSDLGGLSAKVSDSVTRLKKLGMTKISSFNNETDDRRYYGDAIRSIKGGRTEHLGGMAVVLENGRFLVGGGQPFERGGSGFLREFSEFSNIKVTKISAGLDHILLLTDAGEVFSMLSKSGKNKGQLGTGGKEKIYIPFRVPNIPPIRKIRAGLHASYLIDYDNNLWMFGGGGAWYPFGQSKILVPTKGLTGVQNVFSGFISGTTFIQKTDGTVLAAGRNEYGQCGVGYATSSPSMGPLEFLVNRNLEKWEEIKFNGKNPLHSTGIKKISCSIGASFLLLEDGRLFSCGDKRESGFLNARFEFNELKTFSYNGKTKVLDFVCGEHISVFLTDSGRVYMTGDVAYNKAMDTLEALGKRVQVLQNEFLWEVAWEDEKEREALRKKIEEGRKFKISIWQGDHPDIFIVEKVSRDREKRASSMRVSSMATSAGGRTSKAVDVGRDRKSGAFVSSRERTKYERKMRALLENVESLKKELDRKSEEVKKMSAKNNALKEEVARLRVDVKRRVEEISKQVEITKEAVTGKINGYTSGEVLPLLKFFDGLLTPMRTPRELEKFLHFVGSSNGQFKMSKDVFKFYRRRALRGSNEDLAIFESGVQRAAVTKISQVLEMYRFFEESEISRKHFKVLKTGRVSSFKIGSCDAVYETFAKCMQFSGKISRGEVSPKMISGVSFLLYSFFQHLGITDFSLDTLSSSMSSLKESLDKTILGLQKELSKAMRTDRGDLLGGADEVRRGGAGEVENYLRSLDSSATFFKKFLYLVLIIASVFVRELARELRKPKVLNLLRKEMQEISELNWEILKSVPVGGNSQDIRKKLTGQIELIYHKIKSISEEISNEKNLGRKLEKLEKLRKYQRDLEESISFYLRFKLRGSESIDAKSVSRELSAVLVSLGVAKEGAVLSREELSELMSEELGLDLESSISDVSGGLDAEGSDSDFSIVGCRNHFMKKPKFFYDGAGNLKKEYPKIPEIEKMAGKPLDIFVEFFVDKKVARSNVKVKLVHLFSMESVSTDYDDDSVVVKALRRMNMFKITVNKVDWIGEFALEVCLSSSGTSRGKRVFHRRGIFNKVVEDVSVDDLE